MCKREMEETLISINTSVEEPKVVQQRDWFATCYVILQLVVIPGGLVGCLLGVLWYVGKLP